MPLDEKFCSNVKIDFTPEHVSLPFGLIMEIRDWEIYIQDHYPYLCWPYLNVEYNMYTFLESSYAPRKESAKKFAYLQKLGNFFT